MVQFVMEGTGFLPIPVTTEEQVYINSDRKAAATAAHEDELKMYMWADVSSRMQELASVLPSGGDEHSKAGVVTRTRAWLHWVAGTGRRFRPGSLVARCRSANPHNPASPARNES